MFFMFFVLMMFSLVAMFTFSFTFLLMMFMFFMFFVLMMFSLVAMFTFRVTFSLMFFSFFVFTILCRFWVEPFKNVSCLFINAVIFVSPSEPLEFFVITILIAFRIAPHLQHFGLQFFLHAFSQLQFPAFRSPEATSESSHKSREYLRDLRHTPIQGEDVTKRVLLSNFNRHLDGDSMDFHFCFHTCFIFFDIKVRSNERTTVCTNHRCYQ